MQKHEFQFQHNWVGADFRNEFRLFMEQNLWTLQRRQPNWAAV